MSALAGLVPQVDTIVTNAVCRANHPGIREIQAARSLPIIHRLKDHLDQLGDGVPDWRARLIRTLALTVHHECRNGVCAW